MNKKKILTSAVIITLIAISFLGGNTFAKYITAYKTSASLEVAKWSVSEDFLLNGVSNTSKNVKLATTYSPDSLVDGKIAPGTTGSFGATIDATGTETGVDYKITFDNISGTKPENLVFIYNDKSYSSLSTLSSAISGNIAANADNKILNLEIIWSWPYETEGGDIQDTTDGQNLSNYSFDITITCTQEVPHV